MKVRNTNHDAPGRGKENTMNQNRETIAKKLTDTLATTRTEYKRLQERDRMEQARAGAERIDSKRFAFKEIEQEAIGIVRDAGAKALSIIDAELEKAGGALVEAPSAEAANYVLTIAARDNMTADEVQAGLSKYHDHASQKAIKAAAVRSGLHQFGGLTEAETYVADLRNLRDDVGRTYAPYGFSEITDGYAAMLTGGYKAFAERPGGDALDVFAVFGE